jgi:hypothetical protein
MKWLTDVMNVGQVNDEGVPLDTAVNTRSSRVCGLALWQRVSLTLQGFDELTENEKGELFKNYSSIRSISGRAETEGEEGSYEDHLSCLEEQHE